MTLKAARDLSEVKTVQRFEKREEYRSRDGYGATAQFAALAKELLPSLSEYIRGELKKPTDLTVLLRDVSPDGLAAAGLSSLLHSIVVKSDEHEGKSPEPERTIFVGRAVQMVLWQAGLLKADAKRLRAIAKISDRRKKLRAAERADWRQSDWTRERLLQAGTWFAGCCLGALPDVFVRQAGGVIDVSPEAREWALALFEQVMWAHPVIVPCTSEPMPWTDWRKGGYWDERSPLSVAFVRNCHYVETEKAIRAAFANGSMKRHVDGVNALQSVPWRINERVLEAVKTYGERLAGERLEKSDLSGRKLIAAKAQENLKLGVVIATAEGLKGSPFYTPMNIDWRGRVSPLPHFHYQREDHARALFLFDRGLPLGTQQSINRLMDHAANCGAFEGIDKKSLHDRRKWVQTNSDLIERTAKLKTEKWLEAAEPFAFLAACTELSAAWSHGLGYITHLPVAFDGRCNGSQHFCAMMRAAEEGKHVNLTACATADSPNDIYGMVADKVRKHSDRFPSLGNDLQFYRKLVKRPVMTRSYGVTPSGVRKQIGSVLGEQGIRLEKGEFQEVFLVVMDESKGSLPKAEEAMEFLQEIARVLTRNGETVQWTTPTGLPWANRYLRSKTKRVHVVLQGVRVQRKLAVGYEPAIRAQKAKNSIVANVTHALDAAHLVRTINAGVAAGITNIMTIHDSFGCLAPQAERFNEIIREEFVRMYEEHDPLTEIRQRALCGLSSMAPHLLAQVPERGTLDLSELAKSVYSFA